MARARFVALGFLSLGSLAFCAGLLASKAAYAEPALDHPGEDAVKPYVQSNANAGAAPIADPHLFAAFHGEAGVKRIADQLIDRAAADPRISDIFKAQDLVRLKRTLAEQLCYLLAGPCAYTGRDMKVAHKDLGLQDADFNALVEDMQLVMDKEGVPFRDQNKLLAKLAPMHRVVVVRK
jgi:hemoglobin